MLTYNSLQKEWYKNNEGFENLIEYIDYKIRLTLERGRSESYMDEQGIIHNHQAINNYPELKEYEVWLEKVEKSEVSLMGKILARNFQQACHILACESFFAYANKINSEGYEGRGETSWSYDPINLTIFNRRLFWSEQLAKSVS